MEKKIKFPKWSDKIALYNWVTRKLDEGYTFENDREVNDFLEEMDKDDYVKKLKEKLKKEAEEQYRQWQKYQKILTEELERKQKIENEKLEKEIKRKQEFDKTPIEEKVNYLYEQGKMSYRTYGLLMKADLKTLKEVCDFIERNGRYSWHKRIRGMGDVSKLEVEEILKSIGVIPNFTKIQTQKEAKNIIEKSSLAIEEMKKKIDTSNASIKKLEERIDFETRRIDTARNFLNTKTRVVR